MMPLPGYLLILSTYLKSELTDEGTRQRMNLLLDLLLLRSMAVA
jgi:hypothetical protein